MNSKYPTYSQITCVSSWLSEVTNLCYKVQHGICNEMNNSICEHYS